jgi:cystathionine beta-lyase/cystathionine gamma-synthase
LNSIESSLAAVRLILKNLPKNWVTLTTHRLDIYAEDQAKSQFLQALKGLYLAGDYSTKALEALPTAYDYIRLGHPLSCVLEWILAEINNLEPAQIISFTSKTMPILAMLRKNALVDKPSFIYYDTENLPLIDCKRLKDVYGYCFETFKVSDVSAIKSHSNGDVIFITQSAFDQPLTRNANVNATVNIQPDYGSVIMIHDQPESSQTEALINEIQHVRRRETIAMSPINSLKLLQQIVADKHSNPVDIENTTPDALDTIYNCIKLNTGSLHTPLIASSGLSIQYAILMGLVENALEKFPGKPIKIVVPPNCYGGTNDQARRVAALINQVEIVDLLVDGGQNLVKSLEFALTHIAEVDGVPIVIAEIPTNPRVEVPDMQALAKVLSTPRQTQNNLNAVQAIFMVDQTFCPDVKLLQVENELAETKIVSFSSGSKFPSGGHCIAGYCAANDAAKNLMQIISSHLVLSDNNATANQLNTLAKNMPSMPERIKKAYRNTLKFVEHIQNTLPQSKINFVSQQLADQGFTPSVFSLDLPPTGNSQAEREENKRILNKKLIDFMIKTHPEDCKYCVSYGQLKGSYWTIPATSTQGTTKEGDKDYIVRVALSPDVDVEKLSTSFSKFCTIENLI